MQESQLIKKAQRNDRIAQRELYEHYKSYWYTICLRYTESYHDAQDVLQNALINIYTKLNQFDTKRGDFKAWSSKVVVNENLMFLRKKTDSKILSIDKLLQGSLDRSIDTSDSLSAHVLLQYVQDLPEGYRKVFNLYVMEGYDHKEISEILGIGIGTSKSQLHKAKKMLRQSLEPIIRVRL